MTKITLFSVLALFSISGFSQPNFAYYYTPAPGADLFVRPIVATCYDGSLIGTSVDTSGINTFLLFKVDKNGNMLWQKTISLLLTSILTPHKVCMLRDSTLAILMKPQFAANDFIVVKSDLSGNVIWAKSYSCPYANQSPNITPYLTGGFLISSFDYFAFVDSSGFVLNAFHYTNFSFFEVIPDSQNSFIVFGTKHFPDLKYFLLEMDSTGGISNYFTYSLAGDTAVSSSVVPHNFISISPSGGRYCTFSIKGNSFSKFAVFYFDSQNQPVWARKIELAPSLNPRTIDACKDNGCIVTASLYNAGFNFPMVIKFDSAGTLIWLKTPGDSLNPAWNYYDILTMLPDTGSGWYCTLSKNNIHLIHTDSAFNGFCNYLNYQPVISTINVTSTAESSSSTQLQFSSVNLNVTVTPNNFYRYDACSELLIDSSTAIKEVNPIFKAIEVYPNPSNELVSIKFPYTIRAGTIAIYNLTGEIVFNDYLVNSDKKEIYLYNIPFGIYFVQVQDNGQIYYAKLLVN